MSRQVVDYWIQQYTIGQFGSVASESSAKLKQLRKLSESDLNSIQETFQPTPVPPAETCLENLSHLVLQLVWQQPKEPSNWQDLQTQSQYMLNL